MWFKRRKKFKSLKEVLKEIDRKWQDMMGATERRQREEKIRARGRADHLWSWMDKKKKEYKKPDWELFKERILVFPPEERLMYLTRWRQLAEADERERNWIDKMRKYQVLNILIPERTTPRITPKEKLGHLANWSKLYNEGKYYPLAPRMTAREIGEMFLDTYPIVSEEELRVHPKDHFITWHKKNYLSKPIKEGNMEDIKLTKVYKVVRPSKVGSNMYYSGLINDHHRLYYPLGQWIADMDGLGIFAYKTYEGAEEFMNYAVQGKAFIMCGEGVELPRNVTIKQVLVDTGIIKKANMGEIRDDWVLLSPFRITGPALAGTLWTEWEKPELEYAPTYSIGDRILIDDEEYLLANIDYKRINLVSLKDANRWSDSIEIDDITKITYEEMQTLINQHGTWNWHKKE